MPRKADHTPFGRAVNAALAERDMRQTDLSASIGKSPTYVNNVLTGRRPATAGWANLVANALQMQAPERAKLHRAAAVTAGFEIDLTLPGEQVNLVVPDSVKSG